MQAGWRMRINYYKVILLVMSYSMSAHNKVQEKEEQDFVASFMDNYDFSSRARDTHEYHSFILGKTREGFTQLETHLANQGFELDGRMVICGYQEDAVPSYYSSSTHAVIDDEKHKKSTQGWQFAAGNLFGFATGFLLKDVNCLKKVCDDPIFEHSMPDRIGLFDDRASIFHRHAFGYAYD